MDRRQCWMKVPVKHSPWHREPQRNIPNGETLIRIWVVENYLCVVLWCEVLVVGSGEADMEKCRIALKIQAGSHCSAYYMKKTALSRTYFKIILFRKQAYLILQFCLFKQNISFSSIYLQTGMSVLRRKSQ